MFKSIIRLTVLIALATCFFSSVCLTVSAGPIDKIAVIVLGVTEPRDNVYNEVFKEELGKKFSPLKYVIDTGDASHAFWRKYWDNKGVLIEPTDIKNEDLAQFSKSIEGQYTNVLFVNITRLSVKDRTASSLLHTFTYPTATIEARFLLFETSTQTVLIDNFIVQSGEERGNGMVQAAKKSALKRVLKAFVENK